MSVRVSVCSALRVARDSEELAGPRLGTRKARVLVAALAAARGTPVTTDRLVDAIWPDRLPLDPLGNLATLVSRLRRTVGDDFVEPGSASYALGREVEVDIDVAGGLVASAAARLGRGEPTLALSSASRALGLLGDALVEECAGAWADGLRREAADLRREARHVLAAAATATGQAELAHTSAAAATEADPYDERAHRDLITALVRGGRPTAALEHYAALAVRLADELGTDPDPETQRLHLGVLRGEPVGEPPAADPVSRSAALVGRDEEVGRLDRAWSAASSGSPSLVVLAGVPGIGKTRLLAEVATLATSSGGLVLSGRCRPGERSLFLQPLVEVLRPVLLALPVSTLDTLLGGHRPAWVRLLPELGELFGLPAGPEVSHDLARRRSFDAVVAVVTGLAERHPVLLMVDDLQYGADVTADLIAHLVGRLDQAPVLVVAASRTEGLPALGHLTALAEPMVLGPLPPSAVGALATAAGFGGRAEEVNALSQGHPLSVVAALQAMSSGTSGVPDTLLHAVAAQVAAVDDATARLAGAASVLGTRVRPLTLARLVDRPEVDVVLACERLVRAGLLAPTGADYDFVNDLVQEAVAAALPEALAVAYHRDAADLLADRPEEMAGHAHAAGELGRAARGYLEAGRTARRSASLDDALALLDLAHGDAQQVADPALTCSVLMERARVHEARASYEQAEQDMLAARSSAVALGDPRLEMRSLWLLGGDIGTARRRTLDEQVHHNRVGRGLAAELGDSVADARFASRTAVLEASRLRLADALAVAEDGVREARGVGSDDAVVRSLDGLKTVHAYCGDADALAATVDEMIPMLEQRRLAWLLQWAVAESALVPAARGDWVGARARIDQALAVNRETGYGAYAGFFRTQRGWLARVSGDLDAAVDDGRRSLAETSPTDHPWWYAAATGTYAAALLDLGRREEAADLCRSGLEALGEVSVEAYTLRNRVLLASATGVGLEEADRLVTAIQTPPGRAWIWGAEVYDALAAGWLAAGEPERAAEAVAPLLRATAHSWRTLHDRATQRISATSSAARSAPSAGTGT